MAVRAVRGATQLEEDVREHMLERVAEMVLDVMESNGLAVDDFISVIFTATSDLVSEFPAYAARRLGFGDVPLICARELEIEGSMPRVVRMMAHVETDLPRADITHVYLHGAANLRRDLTRVRSVPDSADEGGDGPGADALTGPVHVVGAGLLGTSVALALPRAPASTCCSPTSPPRTSGPPRAWAPAARTTGRRCSWSSSRSRPTTSARRVVRELAASDAVVTDVGSIKGQPLVEARATGADLARYVGGHPMAGSERSGPLAASATLFEGRPWAVTPHEDSTPEAVASVRALVALCGGVEVSLTPDEHDLAVARTSHLPHLMAALVAGRLAGAPGDHLALSGQGVRDVTRIAAGDPGLWQQIIVAQRPGRAGPARRGARPLRRSSAPRSPTAPGHPCPGCSARALPAPWPSPASTVARCARRRRCGSRCPTTRASWPGCSRTPGRSASTSRTSTSTTTRAARSARSSWSSRSSAPGTWPTRSASGSGPSTSSRLGDGGRGRAGR